MTGNRNVRTGTLTLGHLTFQIGTASDAVVHVLDHLLPPVIRAAYRSGRIPVNARRSTSADSCPSLEPCAQLFSPCGWLSGPESSMNGSMRVERLQDPVTAVREVVARLWFGPRSGCPPRPSRTLVGAAARRGGPESGPARHGLTTTTSTPASVRHWCGVRRPRLSLPKLCEAPFGST